MHKEWDHVNLGDVIDLTTGYPFSSENYTTDETDIRLLRGDNIVPGNLRWTDAKRWPLEEFANFKNYQLCEGDIVLAMDRPWINAGLKYAIITKMDVPCLLVQRVARLRGKQELDNDFLAQLVGSYHFSQYLQSILTGTAVPHISGQQISDYRVFLPSLAEQRKIAAILSTWDEAITITEQLIAALKRRKQALMQLLLTGEVRFPEFDGQEWAETKLGEVATVRRGASPRPIQDPKWFAESGRAWVRIADVTAEPTRFLNKASQYLSQLGEDKSVKVEVGDLIMSIAATIGVPKIVNIPACIHDGFVTLGNYEDKINREFLYHFLGLKTSQLANSGQPGTQKNINSELVREIEIPLLDLHEQIKVAEILNQCEEEIWLSDQYSTFFQAQKRGLMQQLLTGKIRVQIDD